MPLYFSDESVIPAFTGVPDLAPGNFYEQTTGRYQLALVDAQGAGLDSAVFSDITLTLLDEETRLVVNDRMDQDVLGSGDGDNNVSLSETGLLIWIIQSEDTTLVDTTDTKRLEYHRAMFRFTFDVGSGPEIGQRNVRFAVFKNLVPNIPE